MEQIELKTFFSDLTGLPNGINGVRELAVPHGLPRLIANRYDLKQAEVLGIPFVLAIPLDEDVEIRSVLAHLENLKKTTKGPIAFIFKKLKAHQQKSLISNKVNFIDLAGNLYLPEALLVLQKVKQDHAEVPEQLSQWAKIAIIKQLVSRKLQGKTISELADGFKISKMHAGRFVDELKALGFVKIDQHGTSKRVQFLPTQELWKKALLYLSNPVVKRFYTETKIPKGKFAGITALGEMTMLDSGALITKAVGKKAFMSLENKLKATPKESAKFCLEVWDWEPEILATGNTVDSISLYLSLKDNDDDRTQIALKELLRDALEDK